jgi:hypothetical protein
MPPSTSVATAVAASESAFAMRCPYPWLGYALLPVVAFGGALLDPAGVAVTRVAQVEAVEAPEPAPSTWPPLTRRRPSPTRRRHYQCPSTRFAHQGAACCHIIDFRDRGWSTEPRAEACAAEYGL